mmetsp:Transcript_6618/g.14413  ORF Transcript_6618/g.14413 Transcript_6618/m.14413 type:complete len:243 (+) Transcript_6618:150-878(+)
MADSPGKVAVVFADGGMGEVGKHVVGVALKQGLTVQAMGMPGSQVTDVASVTPVELVRQDLLSQKEVHWAKPMDDTELAALFEGLQTVICCVGNRQPGMDRCAAASMRNIVQACKKSGVARLVCISSVGIGDSWPPMPWSWVGTIFKVFLLCCIRSACNDLNLMEDAVAHSGLDYLIVRPTGLSPDKQPEGQWKLLKVGDPPGETVHYEVAKEDVAAFMLSEALRPTLHQTAVTIGSPMQSS